MDTGFPSPPSLCVSLSCSERSRDRHSKSRSKDSSSRSEKNVTINAPPVEPLLGDQPPPPPGDDTQVSGVERHNLSIFVCVCVCVCVFVPFRACVDVCVSVLEHMY